jgi:hypothetical protein
MAHHQPHLNHRPRVDVGSTPSIPRHRANISQPDIATLGAAPATGRGWTESAHRIARLSVVVILGAAVTGGALVWTTRMHTVTQPVVVASAPSTAATDPPWTTPLPTVSTPPTATAKPTPTPTPKPTPTSTAPAATPTRKVAASTTPRAGRTTTKAAPSRAPGPALLGPGGDGTLETTLTVYCVHLRGKFAVAVHNAVAGGWGCRLADRTTALKVGAACRWHFGRLAWAKKLDDDNPYSWRCFRS